MSRVPNFPDYGAIARTVAAIMKPRLGFRLDAKELADRVKSDKPRRGQEIAESFERHIYEMTELHHGR